MERKILTYGGYFESFMASLTESVQEKIHEEGLFELRTEYESNIYRVFFIFDEGKVVVLFNGFQKKTQKTPRAEIEKALRIKTAYYADKQS